MATETPQATLLEVSAGTAGFSVRTRGPPGTPSPWGLAPGTCDLEHSPERPPGTPGKHGLPIHLRLETCGLIPSPTVHRGHSAGGQSCWGRSEVTWLYLLWLQPLPGGEGETRRAMAGWGASGTTLGPVPTLMEAAQDGALGPGARRQEAGRVLQE